MQSFELSPFLMQQNWGSKSFCNTYMKRIWVAETTLLKVKQLQKISVERSNGVVLPSLLWLYWHRLIWLGQLSLRGSNYLWRGNRDCWIEFRFRFYWQQPSLWLGVNFLAASAKEPFSGNKAHLRISGVIEMRQKCLAQKMSKDFVGERKAVVGQNDPEITYIGRAITSKCSHVATSHTTTKNDKSVHWQQITSGEKGPYRRGDPNPHQNEKMEFSRCNQRLFL